ncbi:hypothetical protein [Christiangramia sabulilitoris]|uniref:Uracil-DNA glycosylase-like domain-containing protein n=1 Tax=Christiangramia sabulilitoris TaxID=2583991 RepID=A0A550I7M0_9FLAO|nr:hypothetical protein [Christiangramia sabulilitoris]TRO66965.1 hypothetical protein FGM01_03485 [Christiangramia sabulilitoris]
MKPTNYSEISEGANLLHQQILAAGRENPEIKALYKGCQLLFSPLQERPKILLIGFNPGGGYYKWHGKIVEEFEPMEALEYYLNTHPLAEQTKSLFRQAGREEDLKHYTVKSNFYFWATDNVADFNKLLKLLPKKLSQKIFHQARVWTKQLIEELNPELVIAEGFKAYEEIAVLFPEKLQEENLGLVRSFTTPEGVKVMAYKRNQGSIVGKEKITKAINHISLIPKS